MSNKKIADQFKTFLGSLDLELYRSNYRAVKIVEMDLPKQIQALDLLYSIYWDQRRFIDFDEFYREYLSAYKKDIETFRKKIMMCRKCFYRGLPARIYRTWASIITQIQAGYVAAAVFTGGRVEMSSALDHKGADFRVLYRGKALNYQVKKETFSREVRRQRTSKDKLDGEFIDIGYFVPRDEYFQKPENKKGEPRKPYLRFKNDKTIERLSNGFVVFTSVLFAQQKNRIDSAGTI